MNEEIKKLLIKAEGETKEALDAMIMLTNIYTYGLYGGQKDLEKEKYWSNRAKELEQRLSKDCSATNCAIRKAHIWVRI